MERFIFAGHGGKELPAVVWLPEGDVRAVIQVTHGMTEHMGRYEQFAAYFAEMGIAVAVTSNRTIEKYNPKVVVRELNMPEVKGHDVTMAWRKSNYNPAIALFMELMEAFDQNS